MRKVKYYVSTTIDGFTAHEDGGIEGFLMEGPHATEFFEGLKTCDTVLMGRGAYDYGRKFGVTNPYPAMAQYVFSTTIKESPDPNVKVISGDIATAVRELKSQSSDKDIWLCGGSDLASSLFAEGLIDELIVKLNPLVFGKGKSLFSPHPVKQSVLHLVGTKAYDNGVVLLHYVVNKEPK